MKKLNKLKGDIGENIACNYLKKQNYRIIETNYRTKTEEIDIIAQEKSGIIVFVEVKSRSSFEFGRPCEAVGVNKQKKIRCGAEFYLKTKKLYDAPCRFDVIEIFDDEINHIKDAF